jgi:signal transduction histidine kinase
MWLIRWSVSSRAWRAALLLAALTLGMAFAHVLEWPEKMAYGPGLWTTVNQSLYGYFAAAGGPVELANLGLLGILVIGWRVHDGHWRKDLVVAAGCFAVALVVWLAVVNPVNAEVSRWAPGSVPPGWGTWRERWEFGHAGRFVLMLAGYVLLAGASFVRPRRPAALTTAVGQEEAPGPPLRRPGEGTGRGRGDGRPGPADPVRRLALGVLVFLCYPALEMARGQLSASQLAATTVATVAVVGLYLWVVWHRRPPGGPGTWAAWAAMVATGIVVPVVWGASWTGLLLFPAVAAAVVLPAAAGSLTAAGLAAVIAVEGTAVGADGGLILSLSLVTVLAGLAAAGYVRLVEANSQLQAAQAEIARLAAAQERARMGRDLHDSVKQHLFVASMQLGTARMRIGVGGDDARPHLDGAAQAVSEAKSELSELIHRTRPPGDARAGLAAALFELASNWTAQSGIQAEVSAAGERECPPDVEGAMVRACQEALVNVWRHAHATKVQIILGGGEDGIELQIADNGAGFDASHSPGTSHGLAIIRERLAEAGGTAAVRAVPGEGTTVVLCWPASRVGALRP